MSFIHRAAEKRISRKPAHSVYAVFCMSIRSELRAAASPSDGSTDLTGSEGETPPARGVRRPP